MGTEMNTNGGGSKPPPQAEALLALVTTSKCVLFHDEMDTAYARIRVKDHWEIWPVNSTAFGSWLRELFWRAEGKTVHRDAFTKVIHTLESKALFDGEEFQLGVRLAWHDDAIWYDLCDSKWRAIKITEEGWEIVNEPPIIFKRYRHQQPLELPAERGSDIEQLLPPFLNVKSDDQRILLITYIATCFIPGIPHPILNLYGEKGSRKTTISKMVRRLVDPAKPALLSLPNNRSELAQQLAHNYFPFFDNVSHITREISDSLCRAVTGDGFSKRKLFTDEEDVFFDYQCCVGLNGINLTAKEPDLLDRSILIELVPSEDRRTEKAVWESFEMVEPHIIATILDTVSGAMRLRYEVEVESLPRMADFALWGAAMAEALGYGHERFLSAYRENIGQQNDEALHSSPIAQAVITFMQGQTEWEGSPTELLAELEAIALLEKFNVRSRRWPQGVQALLRRLKEVQSNLLSIGILIEHGQLGQGRRFIRLIRNATTVTEKAQPKDKGGDGCDIQSSGNGDDQPSQPNLL